MTGDPELLRRYAEEGSEEAFAELVRRHIDFVYGVALRHARTPHRAEDAAQAVFTDLARKARALAGRTELVGWLFVSARYAALKIVRREALRAAREQEAGVIQRAERQEGRGLDWRKLEPLLDDALETLGERDSSAVLLRCVKELSFAEVGAILGLSEEAARKRCERALERIRRRLDRRGLDSTAAAIGAALTEQTAMVAPAGLAVSVSRAALAAGGKGSALATMFHLMSTSKITATAALVAGILAVGAAFKETQAEAAAQRVLATARADAEGAQQRLAAARERNQADEAAASRLAAAQAAAGSDHARGTDANQVQTASRSAREDLKPPFAADPAKAANFHKTGQEYLRAGARLYLLSTNNYIQHPLTPAQIDALVNLEASELNLTINGIQVPGNSPDDTAKWGKDSMAIIGAQAARELNAMNPRPDYRGVTADVAGYLAADAPLDSAAASQLTAILQQYQVVTSNSDWPAALAAAAKVLSPPQEAVLRTYATSKTGVAYPEQATP